MNIDFLNYDATEVSNNNLMTIELKFNSIQLPYIPQFAPGQQTKFLHNCFMIEIKINGKTYYATFRFRLI